MYSKLHQKPVPFNTIHSISNISSDSMKNILIVKNANMFDLLKTQNLSHFFKMQMVWVNIFIHRMFNF